MLSLSSFAIKTPAGTWPQVIKKILSPADGVEKSGKKFFYKVTMDKREMALDMMKEFTDNFFDGNTAEMVRFVERETVELLVK